MTPPTQEERLAYFAKTAKDAIDAMHMIHLAELGSEAVYQPIVERVREQWRCCFAAPPPALRRVTDIAEAKDAVEEMLRCLEREGLR